MKPLWLYHCFSNGSSIISFFCLHSIFLLFLKCLAEVYASFLDLDHYNDNIFKVISASLYTVSIQSTALSFHSVIFSSTMTKHSMIYDTIIIYGTAIDYTFYFSCHSRDNNTAIYYMPFHEVFKVTECLSLSIFPVVNLVDQNTSHISHHFVGACCVIHDFRCLCQRFGGL